MPRESEVYLMIGMLFVLLLFFGAAAVLTAVLVRRGSLDPHALGTVIARTSLTCGLLACVLTILVAIMTFTALLEATPFNGPLGLVAFLGLPAALVGIVTGAFGTRSPQGRGFAVTGLLLSASALGAWIFMQAAVG